MDAALILVMADGKQTEIPLRRPVQVIGRQTDCQIRIPTGEISRHHCEVSLGEGKVSVRDLGSSNGTFVNRRRVTQTDVQAGDLIGLGDMVFVVKVDGRPAHVDSEDVLEDGQVKPGSAPKAAAPAAKPAAPAPAKKSLLDDENEGSSVGDFDFLDEDEDIKKQPKL
jgi:pSer/pThr/pTyr-binding forkhead associated (FHA) protein